MSSLVRLNPQSQSYVSQGQDGRFQAKPFTRQGIVSNAPKPQPEVQVLAQNGSRPAAAAKIIY